MNAQQDTTFYPSTHIIFLPVEFQILARVYQPVEICRRHQQFQRFKAISMWLEAKLLVINVTQFCFFGLAGEDTTVKFQSVTELSPIVSDSFPKIIGMCLGRRNHKRPRI